MGRHGAELIKSVSIDDAGGKVEIVIHMNKQKRYRRRWGDIIAATEQSELGRLLGGGDFELYGVWDG